MKLVPASIILLLTVFVGCSSDAVTDSLSVRFTSAKVTLEKQDGKPIVKCTMGVQCINRTEHGMNIAFIEGTIVDAQSKRALVRFRPIIPESYGSHSTGQLLPKQVKEFQVVTPIDLDGSSVSNASSVVIRMEVQTTDGYRTEVVSAPVPVASK